MNIAEYVLYMPEARVLACDINYKAMTWSLDMGPVVMSVLLHLLIPRQGFIHNVHKFIELICLLSCLHSLQLFSTVAVVNSFTPWCFCSLLS